MVDQRNDPIQDALLKIQLRLSIANEMEYDFRFLLSTLSLPRNREYLRRAGPNVEIIFDLVDKYKTRYANRAETV